MGMNQSSAVSSTSNAYSTAKRKRRKGTTKKKPLNYNYKEVSGMLLRAKKPQSAAAALRLAKTKLGTLKRNAASGQYDRTEVYRAEVHAQRMVQCAQLKVRNMKTEDEERHKKVREHREERMQRKNERKRHARRQEQKKNLKYLTQLQKQKRELKELERKKHSNRSKEDIKVLEANMRYIKESVNKNSDCRNEYEYEYETSTAAVLELGGTDAAEASLASVGAGSGAGASVPEAAAVSVDTAV